jgi:hypothetical protein
MRIATARGRWLDRRSIVPVTASSHQPAAVHEPPLWRIQHEHILIRTGRKNYWFAGADISMFAAFRTVVPSENADGWRGASQDRAGQVTVAVIEPATMVAD